MWVLQAIVVFGVLLLLWVYINTWHW